MQVILILSGRVQSVIEADSIARAQQFYPAHVCVERTQALAQVGPGWLTADAGVTFTVPAPVAVDEDRRITRLAFRNRFTTTEKVTLEIASLDNPAAPMPARQQAASLRVYLADLESAQWVDLARPETRAGVQTLEAAGLIAAGRAALILDAPITPVERPTAQSLADA